MRRFTSGGGGDSYRPSTDHYSPQQRGSARGRSDHQDSRNTVSQQQHHEFTFRSDRQGPRFGGPADYSRPYPEGPRPNGPRSKGPNSNGPNRRNTNPHHGHDNQRTNNTRSGRQGWGSRGGFPFTRTHNRPLLTAKREITPERLAGMSDGLARFKSFQALSQGEESAETSPASETDESDVEPPNKKMARGDDRPSNAIPKWSNPDPYTSLPPPDESKGKKKDVVQMIRKAKVLQDPAGDAQSSVAEDFIPFDFGDDQDQDLEGQSLKNEGRNKEPSTGLPVLESAMKSSVYSLDENILSRRAKTQPLSKKRKLETPLDGSLRAEWMAIDATLAKPWCVTDRSSLQDVGQWLHYEIIDFYDYVRPRSFEAEIRHHLIQRVQHAIVRKYAARVSCFGSFAANMYLPTADMDLVALSDQYSRGGPPLLGRNTSRIHAFAQDLQRAGLMQSDSKEVVAKAKVPLVKYVDSLTGIPVDISFENVTGLDAIPTFEKWSADYPAMPVIVSVVKQFLSMRGLNEMYHGGMNSFTIICLVVSLLQHYPAIQDGSVSQVDILGNILLHFFDFYGNKFERATTEIRVNPPAHLPKQNVVQAKADRLCVIDPNNPANDISGGTSLIGLITKIFSEAHRTLVQRMAELSEQTPEQRKGRSILGSIIGGDYSSFEKQRSRLKGLADTHGGSRRRRK